MTNYHKTVIIAFIKRMIENNKKCKSKYTYTLALRKKSLEIHVFHISLFSIGIFFSYCQNAARPNFSV